MLTFLRIAAVGFALLSAVGCGGSNRIEPLIGDDPELLQYVTTTVPDLSTHAPTRAVHALYEALVKDDLDAAWLLLSADTRGALDETARARAAGSGKALFLTSADGGGLPLARADGSTLTVPALLWLLADEISYYLLKLDPEESPRESETETTVYLIDAKQHYRAIQLRREEASWRIHHPSLQLADIPGLTTDVGRTSLP